MFRSTKIAILTIAIIFTMSFLAIPAAQAAEGPLTKGKLGEIIVNNSDLQLPEGTENLEDEEYYEVLFNLLSSNGLEIFNGAKKDDFVSYDEFIPTLYILTGGEAGASSKDQIGYLADHGYIPSDFQIVESVREGIQAYYDKNEAWPSELDNAINGTASSDNPFFTVVLVTAIDTSWAKNDFLYTAPQSGAIYTYEPATGNFMTKSNVDLRFAPVGTFTIFQRPHGEPKEDKELIDA